MTPLPRRVPRRLAGSQRSAAPEAAQVAWLESTRIGAASSLGLPQASLGLAAGKAMHGRALPHATFKAFSRLDVFYWSNRETHLLITDVIMPEMNGRVVTKALSPPLAAQVPTHFAFDVAGRDGPLTGWPPLRSIRGLRSSPPPSPPPPALPRHLPPASPPLRRGPCPPSSGA